MTRRRGVLSIFCIDKRNVHCFVRLIACFHTVKKNKHSIKNNRVIDGAFTANNFNLYENLNEDDEFAIIIAMPILDNETYIGALLDNVEYGTINSRESLAGFIEDFRREQEQYNRSNARPSWEGGTDERVRGLDIRQSANGKRSYVGTEEDNLLFRDSEAEPRGSNFHITATTLFCQSLKKGLA